MLYFTLLPLLKKKRYFATRWGTLWAMALKVWIYVSLLFHWKNGGKMQRTIDINTNTSNVNWSSLTISTYNKRGKAIAINFYFVSCVLNKKAGVVLFRMWKWETLTNAYTFACCAHVITRIADASIIGGNNWILGTSRFWFKWKGNKALVFSAVQYSRHRYIL